MAGRFAAVIGSRLLVRVVVRTTCDGGSGDVVLFLALAYTASSARNRYTCNGTIKVGSALLNESKWLALVTSI